MNWLNLESSCALFPLLRVSRWIMYWSENEFISGRHPSPYKIVLEPNPNSKIIYIIAYPWFVGPPAIKPSKSRSRCLVLGARGCVKSLTLDEIWRENEFISGRHHSPYKLVLYGELGPTQILRSINRKKVHKDALWYKQSSFEARWQKLLNTSHQH